MLQQISLHLRTTLPHCEHLHPVEFGNINRCLKEFGKRPHCRLLTPHGGERNHLPHVPDKHICQQQQAKNVLMHRLLQWGTTSPSKVPIPMVGCGNHLIYGSLYPHESTPKRHLDRISRICTAYLCVMNNNTHTHRHTTCDICSNRPHLCTTCTQCCLKTDGKGIFCPENIKVQNPRDWISTANSTNLSQL